MDQGALTVVMHLAKVLWAWAMRFGFPQRILRVLTSEGCSFEGCAADPLKDHQHDPSRLKNGLYCFSEM